MKIIIASSCITQSIYWTIQCVGDLFHAPKIGLELCGSVLLFGINLLLWRNK